MIKIKFSDYIPFRLNVLLASLRLHNIRCVTRQKTKSEELCFHSRQGQKLNLFCRASRSALRTTQSSLQCVLEALLRVINQSRRETDHARHPVKVNQSRYRPRVAHRVSGS